MSSDIPMMFRAQIEARCQIQRLIPGQTRQDADDWADEWIEGSSSQAPRFASRVKTKEYEISWRFVSNSGQDEGVIRPAIGAKSWPYYPGSSMKGAFLRACSDEEALEYCGGEIFEQGVRKTQQGLLRFHGGYPKEDCWRRSNLVDVVHPQENWQVTGEKNGLHSAFFQVSLYKPTLVFGISSTEELDEAEWEKIWKIWERSLARGIGCRVSEGYGQPTLQQSKTILKVELCGEGLACVLINKTGEFRPNMFKAALRGHTLGLFSGVTHKTTAQTLTKELWGGFGGRDGSIVGLLGIAFRERDLHLDKYEYDDNIMPTYKLRDGTLNILPMRELSEQPNEDLEIFVTQLVKFSMLLGGFGKSWRGVDHRKFHPDYVRKNVNPLIGCHWEFAERSQSLYCTVNELSDLTTFLNEIYERVQRRVKLRGKKLSSTLSSYREAWHPKKVQVWARIAHKDQDSRAVKWFHGPYTKNGSIKKTDLTGSAADKNRNPKSQIGCIWHRMYPHYITEEDGSLKATGKYVEIITIFPDTSKTTVRFLTFLASSNIFTQVWGTEE